MKTKSLWGNPPKRLYKFIKDIQDKYGKDAEVCVIGGSDGKFVLPMLRAGLRVTAIEFDKIALYGGIKEVPVDRDVVEKKKYEHITEKTKYTKVPCKLIKVRGLLERVELENLGDRFELVDTDFYHNGLNKKFDAVFTSCSIQYKSNRDMRLDEAVGRIQDIVKDGGLCYFDYMMPLEDAHEWKSELFARTGEMRKLFKENWRVLHNYEQRTPVFEAAHVDRPEDHYHRFGYIMAEKECA